ncbi:cytochrome P450 [Novosphingobium humi]|uniref:cytochrome P450 n=1 Tax=Novosphingobium humi TaxID=2282397 RepID=UPI0025AF8E11|nr:cytochrome P450 [Novosphingobium humi]WJT01024.1 cytochrome P450 [Novosphingobium humi]
MTAQETIPTTRLDLSDAGIWHRAVPYEEFARMRREAPVAWNERHDGHKGFWAVAGHEAIIAVSADTETYSSRHGVISLDDFDSAQNDARRTLLEMDAPQHAPMRKITFSGFSPKGISHLETAIRAKAVSLLEGLIDAGPFDAVSLLSKQLPISTLCSLLGVPAARQEDMIRWSDLLIGSDDPDFLDPAYADFPEDERRMLPFGHPASLDAFAMGRELAEARRISPQNDVVSVLANATVDGRPLTDNEFCNYFLMLVVAGNETTRHSISHGLKALADNPGEWARFRADALNPRLATGEIVRWASPVFFVRRVAMRDAHLMGANIRAGDKVAMYFISGNRDEAYFDQPDRFIIDRAQNPHMAFGKGGPHYCLGNHVAQLQIRILLEEMALRVARIEVEGPMDRLRSNHVHGVKSLPISLHSA